MEAEADCEKVSRLLRRTQDASASSDAPADPQSEDPQAFHHLLSTDAEFVEQEEAAGDVYETTPAETGHR